MSETLGDRIKQAYKAAKLNRNQFAKSLGTVYHNVIRWESGAQPGPEYLKAISEITGVSVDWLLHGEQKLVSDETVLRVVEEFEASLDGEELAEYRELGGLEWGKSLAFAADAMRQLGTEPTPSLVRRLWGERRGQLSGKLRAVPRSGPVAQPQHRVLRRKPSHLDEARLARVVSFMEARGWQIGARRSRRGKVTIPSPRLGQYDFHDLAVEEGLATTALLDAIGI